jgi:2-iminoacetate synthase
MTDLRPPLDLLAEWVRATDAHAAHRLPLLAEAQRIAAGEEEASAQRRVELAAQLARWRYQHLDERRGSLDAMGRRLADVLDVAANQLAGRTPRPPRCPRDAVAATCCEADAVLRAAAALDPQVPLQEVTQHAAHVTAEHFAVAPRQRRRMLLYAPLYLSSHCMNHCAYCGFRYPSKIERKHLGAEEALRQAEILRGRGFRHLLLVAGEFPRLTGTQYFVEIIRALVERGFTAAVEIAPQTTDSYASIAAAGACGVTLYQETYNEQLYELYHPCGTKVSYDWRLEGLERAAEAGMQRLGLGILLGLAEPQEDLLSLIRHGHYLQNRFPACTLALSLPRIHDAPPDFEPPYRVDDELFVRMYAALRLAFPQAELVLSTRESADLRDRLAGVCITQISAGSSTVPGGYEESGAEPTAGGQFVVHDQRTPAEMAAWLDAAGFEVAWGLAAG